MAIIQKKLIISKLKGAARGIIDRTPKVWRPEDVNDELHKLYPKESKELNVVEKMILICTVAKESRACARCKNRIICKEKQREHNGN